MKGSLYTIVYAVVLGTVCAALLTGVGGFTAPYRQANEKAEEMRNVLGVLGVPFEPRSSSKELIEIFDGNVRVEERDGLTLYVYADEERVRAVAVPFEGQGLWGPVKGFLSLEPDMTTIRGVAFHEQEETPGLGGEIASTWFRNQFIGKSIVAEDESPGIRIRRGGHGPNEVDAITGATMTCEKVEAMLNTVIVQIVRGRE